ncbi:hypothetical protein DQ04_02311110 [Trypanosoma grayi]|uniref:hypothetical protein n=1 Tax=Trypanosoma grayi TaxID=71804 RepID=UPI0004F41E61|nr:hypothetical protein DQ04_02311110 [Trypanosoma grayi]KEG11759.1 hypothetical protein DQ04_02311110 [Trypanosoma grayi]
MPWQNLQGRCQELSEQVLLVLLLYHLKGEPSLLFSGASHLCSARRYDTLHPNHEPSKEMPFCSLQPHQLHHTLGAQLS